MVYKCFVFEKNIMFDDSCVHPEILLREMESQKRRRTEMKHLFFVKLLFGSNKKMPLGQLRSNVGAQLKGRNKNKFPIEDKL